MIIRSLRQWWTKTNDVHLFAAQEKLLTSLVQSPMVGNPKNQTQDHGLKPLNAVEFRSNSNNNNNDKPTVILLHGFGSGLGFFFRNVDPLLQSGQVRRVILVDWLGMGGSYRPPCRRPIRAWSDCSLASLCQSRFDPSQAVDFFIDPLQEWLQHEVSSKDDEPVWMVGHSLGGYLLARYALKHATANKNNNSINLQKVVLASPVGFPSKPTNLLPAAQLPTAMRLVDALWSANVTPQQLVRAMGATRGRNAVRRALAGRIPHLTNSSNVVDLLADYLFHITVAHPSGEFAMNSLLEPGMSPEMAGVFAREPLEPLFQEYANHSNPASTTITSKSDPSSRISSWKVLFGDHDWMRPNEPSARTALDYLNNNKATTTMSSATVSIVPNAGHHLYLDNPADFVDHILN